LHTLFPATSTSANDNLSLADGSEIPDPFLVFRTDCPIHELWSSENVLDPTSVTVRGGEVGEVGEVDPLRRSES
jgi:hypothetical protein